VPVVVYCSISRSPADEAPDTDRLARPVIHDVYSRQTKQLRFSFRAAGAIEARPMLTVTMPASFPSSHLRQPVDHLVQHHRIGAGPGEFEPCTFAGGTRGALRGSSPRIGRCATSCGLITPKHSAVGAVLARRLPTNPPPLPARPPRRAAPSDQMRRAPHRVDRGDRDREYRAHTSSFSRCRSSTKIVTAPHDLNFMQVKSV
jgi:hypothetical protein